MDNFNRTSFDESAVIILAAGLSRRMGKPKMLLPWGDTTVLGKVVSAFQNVGFRSILVVSGGFRDLVEEAAQRFRVDVIFNPLFENGEMLDSLKIGLRRIDSRFHSIFVALGDQPQIEEKTIRAIWQDGISGEYPIVMPSYQNRRGHPWLIRDVLWGEILNLAANETMRDFFKRHSTEIRYTIVDTDSIIMDLDTPTDYENHKPQMKT